MTLQELVQGPAAGGIFVGDADGGDGSGQVASADAAVTDDHDFVQSLVVFLQLEIDDGGPSNRFIDGGIAQAGDGELAVRHGGRRDGERITAVRVGGRAHGIVARQHHDGADDRFAVGVLDLTPDGDGILRGQVG